MIAPKTANVLVDTTAGPVRARVDLLYAAAALAGSVAFLMMSLLLFPYFPGPNNEALWWEIVGGLTGLSCAAGAAGLLIRYRHLADLPAAAVRAERQWVLLALATTLATGIGYGLLSWLIHPGSGGLAVLLANLTACAIGLAAVGVCALSPIGRWWELFYSVMLLLMVLGAFGFWFPALDGVYVAALFVLITWKWLGSPSGTPSRDAREFLLDFVRINRGSGAPAPISTYRKLSGLMLLLAAAPLLVLGGLRPFFNPWDAEALYVFRYVMLTATILLYAAPMLTTGSLLFCYLHLKARGPEALHNRIVRREARALVLFGAAALLACLAYTIGQRPDGPLAYVAGGFAVLGVLEALQSRRGLVIFALLLPITVGVTLIKLRYIGDFILPLMTGAPIDL